ncbi:MAG: hypothetical protein JWR38_4783 [Mucilaginibacter sp.]|nr:hypothetical protein [Mucilaginibacter sp.]
MKKIIFAVFVLSAVHNMVYAQHFKVSYADTVFKQPFTGYVFLYLSSENKAPKDAVVGLDVFPCFSMYVKNVKPGQSVIIDDKAASYPTTLSNIARGEYYVQAIWDRNLGGRAISESPGNLYSVTQKVNITKDYSKQFSIIATKVIPDQVFKETQYVKEIKAPSALLSKFLNKQTTINAAIQLPKEYFSQPNRKFPVEFFVFGYGGDYHRLSGNPYEAKPIDTSACIIVYLDGNCPLGHCVYANSENNGPWGDALTTEFIPALEKQYRCNGAMLLTGHSSGGWTVLWLQTHYPKVFDGCWSSSPDPVDFTCFQKVNLYTDRNLYYGKDSVLNQVGTVAGFFPWFSMKQAGQMEGVIYRGEQMHSFNAVFSKKGTDGLPQNLWDSQTGVIDHAVFEHWKNYDINAYIRNNWQEIKPDLEGKIRVSVGEQDNFLLNYAVAIMDTTMAKINSKFVFGYYPGDHFTVQTSQYRKDGNQFLERKYREWKMKHPEVSNK